MNVYPFSHGGSLVLTTRRGVRFDCAGVRTSSLTIVQVLEWIDGLPETFAGDQR